MKQIKLKQLQGDNGLIINYKTVLLDVARKHPYGIKLDDEMGKALRVLKAVRASNDILKLEDADWEALVGYLNAYPFAVVDEKLLELKADVENAEEVKIIQS